MRDDATQERASAELTERLALLPTMDNETLVSELTATRTSSDPRTMVLIERWRDACREEALSRMTDPDEFAHDDEIEEAHREAREMTDGQ